MTTEKASKQALAAVRAAKNIRTWGHEAAWRYAQKRGVSLAMFSAALHNELKLLLIKQAARMYENAVRIEAEERRAKGEFSACIF